MFINYTIYHLHDDMSLLDSATKFEKYIDKAKELNMRALGFANHGNIFNWTKKKTLIEQAGMKYIHAQEFYITATLEDKIRDNYHSVLIAKNFQGVQELNKLSSIAYDKPSNHFYYDPRISIDELINTSDNIIVTSACLASPLWKGKSLPIYEKYLEFFIRNKHRCFLEVQPHNVPDQVQYNRELWALSHKHNIPLIAGTDTHSINQDYAEARKILLLAKKIQYTDEDTFDLTMKSYEELVQAFKDQNVLPKEIYFQAIENTNVMADMVEEFKLDKSHKYPSVGENTEKIFKEKINEGCIQRGIHKFPKEKRQQYYNRIQEEFEVYKNLGTIDYMLFQKDIIDYANANEIYVGFGRGSVNGSLIAYDLGITEMDSIKHNLNFFRFLNPNRVTLPDIDIDYPPSRRQEIIDYVASKENIYFAEIVTFNTIQLKGAIRDVGRALNYELSLVDEIAKNIEDKEDEYRAKYPELFKYVDLLNGVNVSVGSHPSGFLVSPIPVDENVGTFYTSESKYPVSQISMKELEKLNFVKLDILGLSNIEIINETCKLAGIERLTPDTVDDEDDAVWEDIKNNGLFIFQFESDYSSNVLKNILNAYEKIKQYAPNVTRIDLMSMANGALRPSGESFRDRLAQGIPFDNGHPGLNELLKDTLGYCIYQEQIMRFLTNFCGFTEPESDSVRRGLAKKVGTQEFLPKIEEGFIRTMTSQYKETKEHAKQILQSFLQIIEDASDYGFSVNHSRPYTYIGYINGYLRYHYPLEFITVVLNMNEDNIEKTAKIVDYAKSKNIKIKPIQFRKSQATYAIEKETNSIYKGIASLKYCNSKIADELYELGKNQYNSFLDLLIDIQKTSINSKQLNILASLNFFSEFGYNQKLLNFIALFNEYYGKKTIKKEKLTEDQIEIFKQFTKETEKTLKDFQSYEYLQYIWSQLEDKPLPIKQQIQTEIEYLGYPTSTFDNLSDDDYVIVYNLETKYSPKFQAYNLVTGKEVTYKTPKKQFNQNKFRNFDILKIGLVEQRQKSRKTERGYEKIEGEFEKWLVKYYVV